MVNNLPAARIDDPGIHAACCGPNTWQATEGSGSVLINAKGAHRKGDAQKHCGGSGEMTTGSADVLTGD